MPKVETEGSNATAVTVPGAGSSAVNIVIPAESVRPLSFMGLGIILAISFSLTALYIADHTGDRAFAKAEQARSASVDAMTEARMSEYYSQQLEMALAKSGVAPPPDPWKGKSKEKSK